MRSKVLELAASLSNEDIEAYLTYVEQLAKAPVDVAPTPELVESYKTEPAPDYLQLIADMEARLQAKLKDITINAPAGADGKDGKDGKNGKDGKDGAVGKAGKDGKDGLDGKDGISVVDASIDFDNRLTITLSDGSVIDAGQINVQSNNSVVQVVQRGGEDIVSYTTRYDQVSNTLAYKGEAAVGSEESYSSWRIQKLVFGVDGDVLITWADGNTNFDNVWENRNSIPYK